MNIKEILETIDTSKMEKYCDLYSICERGFEIFEYVIQPQDNERLTYCYYHRWICTDTAVGIKVWYFDNKPVCISWQPYRKSREEFGWLSEENYKEVRDYLTSLIEYHSSDITLVNDQDINTIIEKFDSIDYKKHEVKNIK